MATASGIEDLALVDAAEPHRTNFVQTWVPYILARRALDPAWTYRMFLWDRIIGHPSIGRTVAAVDKKGSVEGFLATTKQADHLKVAFLSTAPWNHGEGRLRRGIGTALLAVAIEESVEVGLEGELELSSTPESEPFYERLQLARTGDRDHEGLAIFHMSSSRALAHLRQHQAISRKGKGS